MDIDAARRILSATLPIWIEEGPVWEDVLAHESVRGMHALLVHAIEQHGWEDPVEAAFDLLDRDAPRAEERLLTEALATWIEAAGGPAVPPPPEAPGALREWAKKHAVDDLLDRPVAEVDRMLVEGSGAQTVADVYRRATTPSRGRGSASAIPWAAQQVRELLHAEAFRRARGDATDDVLIALESRAWPKMVGRLFAQLTAIAHELRPLAAIRRAPRPMQWRDDPPRFVADAPGWERETGVLLEDGLVPRIQTSHDDAPAAKLALVDGARLSLADADVAAAVEHTLSRPAWQRMLDGLGDALATEEVERRPHGRLEWRIEQRRVGDHALALFVQKPRKNGGFTKGRRVEPTQSAPFEGYARTRTERLALALFTRVSMRSFLHPSAHLADLIESLVDARLVDADTGAAVRVRRAAPRLSFEELEGSLVPRIRIGGVLLPPGEASQRIRDGVAMVYEPGETPTVTISELDGPQRRIVAALAARPAHIPNEPDARRALADRLASMAARVDLDLPEELRGRAVDPDPRTVVRLDLGTGALRVWLGVRPLPGTAVLRPGEGSPVVVSFQPGVAVHARRDFDAERAMCAQAIAALGLGPHRVSDGSYRIDDLDAALDVVYAAQEHAHGVVVEWARDERPKLRGLSATDLSLRVSRQRDWWGIAGGAETELGRVDLAALLRAVREGRRFVEVAPGAFARIEASLRARLLRADAHLREERGDHVFGDPAAQAIEDLAADGAFDAASAFFELADRVRRARAEEPVLDAPIAGVLRPYQRSGFEWLARLGAWGVGGVLADDMGLGKTLQALALLSFRKELGPALVVAPTSVVGNWAREAARFSPELSVRIHRGSAREREVGRPGPSEVLITSYDIAVRDADALRQVHFATVVLDEAQLVKNPATRRARTMRDLAADLKVALTGTPIENHLGELWSIFRIVCPQLLGSWESFRARFAVPIQREGDPIRREQLGELLRPFVLRRTKREVAPELPPRTEMALSLDLSAEERELYDRERQAIIEGLRQRGQGDGRFAVLAALTRLRQLACDARLVHEGWAGPTTKLDELAQLVLSLKDEGHRVLVFSQFRRLLALARDALVALGITCLELVGDTPAAERERRVDAFQSGAADAFLISLKAGGTGLNLTAATYVVHLDPWWNPAAEDQATDRAHRIGQTEPVTVYRLVSAGTIEETVLALHADKRALADGILAGKDAADSLDVADLAALLYR